MSVWESIQYRGHTIEISQDECPSDPREDDNLGTMICFHRRYKLGDEHTFESPEDFLASVQQENIIVLPLYLYDHSGITMRTRPFSCPWDSGQVGWIYVEKARAKQEFSWKMLTAQRIKKIEAILQAEVEIYDAYLVGDIFGYEIEEIDSCWGYFGTDFEHNGLLGDARESVDWYIEQQRKKKQAVVKTWIRHHVPLDKRVVLANQPQI